MADPTDTAAPRFHIDLDDGFAVEADGSSVDLGPGRGAAPALVLRMLAARAHSLAHVLDDWSRAFRLAPNRDDRPRDAILSRVLEDAAAALGDPAALLCAARLAGAVATDRRLAAVEILQFREARLSPLQRIAVVDAAARWMDEEAGDELAYALLAAVCSTDVITSHAYLALLASADADTDR